MSKVIFVGDTHLSGINPSSRKETREQYRQLLLDKLDYIKQICINQGAKNVIILGDVFNNNSGISNIFESEIWDKFLEFKAENIQLHTIVGNHDMTFQNENEFKGTYLYKAFLVGVINHLDEVTIDSVTIKGFDYLQDYIPTDKLNNKSFYNICVAHSFYENERFGGTGNSNLTKPWCEELGYDAYVLGHDHVPYGDVEEPLFKVIRPGSMTRGTSKTCNLYRKVNVSMFDTVTHEWSLVEIPTKPGTEVFNEKVILSKDVDLNIKEIITNLDYSQHTDTYDIIARNEESGRESLKEDYDDVINVIVQNLEAVGIYKRLEESNDSYTNN